MRRQESRERENASRGPALPENTTALDRAFDLHKRGDFAEARSVGETALPQHPDNPSLLRLLGDSSCRSGDLTRRSDERRVGKECVRPCRSRWAPYHSKTKKKLTQT